MLTRHRWGNQIRKAHVFPIIQYCISLPGFIEQAECFTSVACVAVREWAKGCQYEFHDESPVGALLLTQEARYAVSPHQGQEAEYFPTATAKTRSFTSTIRSSPSESVSPNQRETNEGLSKTLAPNELAAQADDEQIQVWEDSPKELMDEGTARCGRETVSLCPKNTTTSSWATLESLCHEPQLLVAPQSPSTSRILYSSAVGSGTATDDLIKSGYATVSTFTTQLITERTVPDTAQSIRFAINGDINGLIQLFKRGLASPRDVSSTRRYSLIRVSLDLSTRCTRC